MRRLVVLRGPPGAGKSTLIRRLGLEGHTLSADTLRRTLSSAILSPEGRLVTNAGNDARVWEMVYELLEERMVRGQLIVLDATHPTEADFEPYLLCAARWRYPVSCVDFTPVPRARVAAQNRGRAEHTVVPAEIVEAIHEACRAGNVPASVLHIPWREDGAHEAALAQWLAVPTHDLTPYTRVHHIGDLQGCHGPLSRYLEGGLRDEDFYLFVGDVCDRGPENHTVLRLAMGLVGRPNVRIHWGNHEDNLHRWCRGETAKNPRFEAETRPQIEAAGITRAEVDAFLDRLHPCTFYTWGERRVMVTHGGLSTVPPRPELISFGQYVRGTGDYDAPVDAQFDALAPSGWVQIHGHRNPHRLPTQAAPRSFNLEGRVEHGGALRVVVLDERGFVVEARR
jgi:predicted kinase